MVMSEENVEGMILSWKWLFEGRGQQVAGEVKSANHSLSHSERGLSRLAKCNSDYISSGSCSPTASTLENERYAAEGLSSPNNDETTDDSTEGVTGARRRIILCPQSSRTTK